MKSRCIVVLGTLAGNPWAGMAWMHMQITVGLRRLGHDAYYFETSSSWPYDPVRQMKVCDSDYAVPYLSNIAETFGLQGRWAYRRSYSDKEWIGLSRNKAEDLLRRADVVLNIAGATQFRSTEALEAKRLVYFGTDPVYDEIALANNAGNIRTFIDEHQDVVTYGENIGNPDCPIPPLPRLRSKTRQPVLIDLWKDGSPSNEAFTTVCNWKQAGHDIVFNGETYYWSKHHEFLKFIELPRRTKQVLELAMGLVPKGSVDLNEQIRASGVSTEDRLLLEGNGWRLVDAHQFSTDVWRYRDYIRASRAEFTVARDQNVRLHSGWFSERSACYLAAGRPVITQDTGFSRSLPTGEGLFAFKTMDDILTAIDAVNTDYKRHSRAASAMAEEYFRAETVLAQVLRDLGL
jgi:YHS domain-containing protein